MSAGYNQTDPTNKSSFGEQTVFGPQSEALQSLYGSALDLTKQQLPQQAAVANQVGADLYNQGRGAIDNLGQIAGGQNPFLQQNINQLGTTLNRNLNEQILPSIENEAIGVGGLGGGRQGIAAGIAGRGTQEAIAQGTTSLQTNAYNQRAGAANAQLGQLGNLFGLSQAPFQSQFAPLQNLGGLLGSATVLGKQGSTSSGGGQFGLNFGFDTSN